MQLFKRSDDELIRQIGRGQERALEDLYSRYGLTLLSYLLRQLEDHALAEDVLQEVMVDVWKSAVKFRGESTVRTWLFSIARYKSLRLLRYKPPNQATIDEETLAADDNPAEAAELLMQSSDVQEAMRQLSPEHREVLDLMFFHDLTGQESADVLGIPLGTLKSRLSRAKAALRHILREEA